MIHKYISTFESKYEQPEIRRNWVISSFKTSKSQPCKISERVETRQIAPHFLWKSVIDINGIHEERNAGR